jgi:cytidine deaminase
MQEFYARLEQKELVDAARTARVKSYSPYSHFQVGAALLTKDGKIFTGCNIESASFSPTNCAERTAVFKAVSEGIREFAAIAIVGAFENQPLTFVAPCGVCRQVLREFCDPDTFQILLAQEDYLTRSYSLEELLPEGFGPENFAYKVPI